MITFAAIRKIYLGAMAPYVAPQTSKNFRTRRANFLK
jgi:hypothetical protein